MPYNDNSIARMDEFLAHLENIGLATTHLTRSNYKINNKKTLIRTTTKPGPIYWYDISKSSLGDIDYYIYQLKSKNNFAIFPSFFFMENYEKLQDSNRSNAKMFYLDSIKQSIASNSGYSESIAQYIFTGGSVENHAITRNLLSLDGVFPYKHNTNPFDDIETYKHTYSHLTKTEQKTIIDSRIGQNVFRDKLIDKWKGCSVTGYTQLEVLVASHIKPWATSNNLERLDVNNGLLLIPNLDNLFDLGYITFNESGHIRYSTLLHANSEKHLGINQNMRLRSLDTETENYLKYHRAHVFRKN